MDSQETDHPLPIRVDPEDDWLEELLCAHRTSTHHQPGQGVASGGFSHEQLVALGGCRAEAPRDEEEKWLVELLGAYRTAAGSVPRAFLLKDDSRVVGSSCVAIPFPATSDLQSLLDQEEACHGKFGFGPLEEAIANPWQDELLWALSGRRRVDGQTNWRGTSYLHCLRRFLCWRIRFGPMAFEIGIASDPHHRYHNDEHGYKHEGIWHFMEVMARDSAQECCMLERWLIHTLKAFPGCQNIRAGGDGVRADRTHTCFVYMVVAAAGTGRSLASARGARMIAQRARKMHFRLAGGS